MMIYLLKNDITFSNFQVLFNSSPRWTFSRLCILNSPYHHTLISENRTLIGVCSSSNFLQFISWISNRWSGLDFRFPVCYSSFLILINRILSTKIYLFRLSSWFLSLYWRSHMLWYQPDILPVQLTLLYLLPRGFILFYCILLYLDLLQMLHISPSILKLLILA